MEKDTKIRKSKAGRNHRRLVMINGTLVVVGVIALLWILKVYLHIADSTYTNDAQIEAYINPINSRVTGYIKEIRFSEHQKVHKGDTLVIIDNNELMAKVDQAEANWENAIAAKNALLSGIETIKSSLQVYQSEIMGQKAKLKNAKENFERYKDLLKDDAVTRQQYDEMETAFEAQKAQYQSLISQQEKAKLAVTEARSKIAVHEAVIKQAKASLDLAKINASYAVICAPHEGVLGRREISEGQLLQAGQRVVTIVMDDQKWVVANFLEKQMPEIKVGRKFQISVDALGGKKLEGVVTSISEATGSKYSSVPVDNATGNFVKVEQRIPVRIDFTADNSKLLIDRLRAGMNVEVEISK